MNRMSSRDMLLTLGFVSFKLDSRIVMTVAGVSGGSSLTDTQWHGSVTSVDLATTVVILQRIYSNSSNSIIAFFGLQYMTITVGYGNFTVYASVLSFLHLYKSPPI